MEALAIVSSLLVAIVVGVWLNWSGFDILKATIDRLVHDQFEFKALIIGPGIWDRAARTDLQQLVKME